LTDQPLWSCLLNRHPRQQLFSYASNNFFPKLKKSLIKTIVKRINICGFMVEPVLAVTVIAVHLKKTE
jgi:hypothetical protein